MANNSAADWDESAPANGDEFRFAAQEIRFLREGIADRLLKEHVAMSGSTGGGEHRRGSAIAYYDTVAPTTRPDGDLLNSGSIDDTARLWIDSDNSLNAYLGGSWVSLNAKSYKDRSIVAADITLNTITVGELADSLVDLTGLSRMFYQSAAPTTDPKGNALAAADNGRIWVDSDDGIAYYYAHPSWTALKATPTDLSVTTGRIADAQITTAKIQDDQITTTKILNAAVTLAKLGSDVGKVAVVTYVGTGSATAIPVTVGFLPKLVVIFEAAASSIITFGYRGSAGVGDLYQVGSTVLTSAIEHKATSFDILTTDADVNTAANVYVCIAIG